MYHLHIRCRLYSATCTRACQVKVPTSCVAQATNRYPLPESVFNDAIMQSYIHDCLVCVHEGKHAYHFRVFTNGIVTSVSTNHFVGFRKVILFKVMLL